MDKLTKQETYTMFSNLAKQYGVLDHKHSNAGHDRVYLGKADSNKALFLACSRVNKMCIYIDSPEKTLLSQNGFICVPETAKTVSYEYKCYIETNDFEPFFKAVKNYLDI